MKTRKTPAFLSAVLFSASACVSTVSAKAAESWQEAYTKVLSENALDCKKFSLVYVDNDDVPELVLHKHTSDDPETEDYQPKYDEEVYLYTFSNGEAKELGAYCYCGFSGFYYHEKEGTIISAHHGGGVQEGQIYSLSNGEIAKLHEYIADADNVENNLSHVDGKALSMEEVYDFIDIDSYTVDEGAYFISSDITQENIETYLPESEQTQLSEEALKTIAEKHGNVKFFEYHDYDGNGTKEAFAVITEKNAETSQDVLKQFSISMQTEMK